jgi:hypothetical protein
MLSKYRLTIPAKVTRLNGKEKLSRYVIDSFAKNNMNYLIKLTYISFIFLFVGIIR